MKRMFTMTAAGLLYATTALAQDPVQSLIAQFQNYGYTHIEVKRGPSQIKIEGVLNGMEREIVVDAATGAILKDETERADRVSGDGSRVEVENDDEDFVGDDDDDDRYDDSSDDDDDDRRDGRDDEDDDEDDDRHGGRDHDDDDDDDDDD